MDGELTVVYLRGVNLISRLGTATLFYLFNAHGDVVSLTNTSGTSTKSYDYDAFGVERNIDEADANPFRYCGEYYDTETGTYYLRARYYDPAIGRFTQEDTHWSVANMIYGDNPQKINECEDALGLKSYSYAPQISCIIQSGNLYIYCGNNPVMYVDPNGNVITPANVIGALIGAGIGVLIGTAIVNHFGLTGWARTAAIAGGTLLSTIAGWFAGPAVLGVVSKVTMYAITSGKLALTSLSSGVISALNLGQKAAQNVINKISGSTEMIMHLNKHLASAGGKYVKFSTDSALEINNLLAKALGMAKEFTVNSKDSFYTIVNMGEAIGTKGEQCIKIVFSIAGEIITAYPVK